MAMKLRTSLVADVDREDQRRIACYFDDDLTGAGERLATAAEMRVFFRNHGLISGRQILTELFDKE